MATERISLAGKIVAITGGARGIGRNTAEALLRQGARIGIGDIDGELARTTAAELGDSVAAYDLDVTDRTSFAAFLDGVERDLGPVDVLINNAGIMPVGPFLEESDETAIRQVDINVNGVILGSKLVLPRMIARGRGHLVNVASLAGKGGVPGIATYCATKHAVVGLTEALRLELRGSGIKTSVVMPNIVNTDLGSGVGAPRLVPKLEPGDVADAIVDALQTDRYDVWVPRSTAAISAVMNFLPRRGREAIQRLLKADTFLTEIDAQGRNAYNERLSADAHEAAERRIGQGSPPPPTPAEGAEPLPRERV